MSDGPEAQERSETRRSAAADGLSQAELARAVGVRPQSMTTLTANLIGRSLIARGVEAGRGRHSRIGLTDAGRALLADAWPVVTASNDWFGADHTRITDLVGLLQPLLGSTPGSDRGPSEPASTPT